MEYKDYLKEVGFRLKRQRTQLGLTQKQLADLISTTSDLSEKQISRFECGENGTRLDKLVELSLALRKTPDYFLLGVDNRNTFQSKIEQINEYLNLIDDETTINAILTIIKNIAKK